MRSALLLLTFVWSVFLQVRGVEAAGGSGKPSSIPFSLEVLVDKQHVRISMLKQMTSSSKLYCVPLKKEQANPTMGYLLEDLSLHPERAFLPGRALPYIIETDEITRYNRVTCVYVSGSNRYGPQVMPLIHNLHEEQVEVAISSVNPASDSVSCKVAVSLPVLVWCNAFTKDKKATIAELKKSPSVYVHKSEVVKVGDLTPSTDYTLYCYAEAPSGTGMKNTLASLATGFATNAINATIANVVVDRKDVFFSIESNVDRAPVCKCLSERTTVLAMNANQDYLCRNSLNLPLILCRYYYSSQMIEVEYRRPVSDAQLLRTGASEMQVIDHSADQSSMNWCILVFQVVFLIIVTVKGIQLTSKCVCLFESRHILRMSTETLQPSLVNRELKRVLGDRVQVCLGSPFYSSCRRRRANPSYSPPPSSFTT